MQLTGASGRPRRAALAALGATLTTTLVSASLAWAGGPGGAPGAEGVFEVRFEHEGVVTDAPAVEVSAEAVTLTAPGTYRLRGALYGAGLVVDSPADGAVRLLFDGVRVQPAAGPALAVRAAERVVVELAPGSFNSLLVLDDEGADPAVRSAAPLRLLGNGHLLILSRGGSGVEAAAPVSLEGGVLTVSAPGDGVSATSLRVSAGDLTVLAGGSALTASAAGQGAVEVHGGRLDLDAGADGVRAEARLELTGGALTVRAGNDALHADLDLEVSGGEVRVLDSEEGLEAPRLTLSGGTVVVAATDDALNAAGDLPPEERLLTVSGGHVVLTAGSDAVDSNGSVLISGGTLVLAGPASVLKPAIDRDRDVRITGGTVVAVAALVLDRATAFEPGSQPVLYVDFHWRVEAGTLVSVSGPDGFLVTYRAPRPIWTFSLTAAGLEAGQAYEVWLGGTPVGAELEGGLYVPAGVEGGHLRHTRRAR